MFLALLSFELKRRFKLLSSYVYAAILFGIGFFLMLAASGAFKAISTATGSERIWANAPVSVAGNMTVTALFGLFTVAAIFGQAATQDFTHGTWSIIFTRKLKKSTYVLGRFFGAFVFSALLFFTIAVGQALAALLAQLIDASQLGPHRLGVYLWPYLTAVLPMLFLAGAIFFCLAALTRQMAPVYVGVVVLVLGYLVLSGALSDVQYRDLASVLDPFGMLAADSVTRYWTPVERNRDLIPLTGVVLANRALWLSVAAALLAITARVFRTTVDEQKGKGSTKDEASPAKVALPTAPVHPTTGSWLRTSSSGGWLLFREVLRSPVYWSFVVAGLSFAGLAIYFGSRSLFGTPTMPVTYQVLELTSGSFKLFSLITITFYSGELVWRERDAGLSDIVFASRVPGWVPFGSKLLALVLIAASLQVVAGGAALTSQLVQGFFDVEPRLYLSQLVLFGVLEDLTLCALALTVQVLINHKYLGHAVMIGSYASGLILRALGVEERLVRFGSEPFIQYSDMNGFGHWIRAALAYRTVWYAVSVILLAVAGVFTVRSRETSTRARLALARQKVTPAWLGTVAAMAVLALGMGGFLFYQTHVAQPYRTSKDSERLQARYEKDYKAAWGQRAQPRIISADVNFDVYPELAEPRLDVKGTYVLENKTSEPISEVLLTVPDSAEVKSLALGSSATPKEHVKELSLYVYPLTPPLEPGATVPLTFELQFISRAIVHGSRLTEVVGNGTFFNNFSLPILGYQTGGELTEDGERKEYGLAPKERMAEREDLAARQDSYIRKDSDFITLRANVSTVPDQLAVVPGTLEKEWTEGGRRHFTYVMDQPILNFFSVLSARYEVLRDEWNGVKLEIYFHPTHRYNLERMMSGMKDALAYCTAAFGPYQHHQARILEFPRYQSFAQSFPNTIPYSEAVGFIAKVREDDPEDLDYPYYVTAHEIAHQWWAHQVVGANVKGATMTSESMAQYSALMVMKQKFGEKKMRRFLKYELDRYLMGRVMERKKELPLARNENQQYIHYQKGSLAMYALQHFIGEDKVNAALAKYVAAVKFKGPPYTTSSELLSYLREATPPEYAYLLDDLFETITLYDNRAISASMKQNAAGTWDVTLKLKAVKYRADEKGAQTELDFSDFIDVGALDEKDEAIFLEPRKLSKGESEVTFTVAQKPARVGVDPINLLVDRTSDDNLTVPSIAP